VPGSVKPGFRVADAVYLTISMVGRVVNIVYMLFAVVKVGARDFGVFSFVQVSALTIATVFTLAMTTSLNVILSRDADRELSETSAAFCICYVGLCAVFFLPILILPAGLVHGVDAAFGVRLGLYILALALVAQSVFQGWLFGFARTTFVAGVTLMSASVALVAIILAPGRDIYTLLTAYDAGAGLAAILFGAAVFRLSGLAFPSPARAVQFARRHGRTLASYGSKAILTSMLFQLALWELQARVISTLGPVESAHYAIGIQFYNIVVFLPVLMSPVLLNRLGAFNGDPRGAARFTSLITLACTALAVLEFGAIFLALPFVSPWMPRTYAQSTAAILWAIGAGTVLFVKTPMSVYFQSSLRMLPEITSVSLSAALLVTLSFLVAQVDASQAAEIRAVSVAVQLLTVGVFFGLSARPPSRERAGRTPDR
jgi:O-antigen/teichoic acid export membrane protein